jgi:Na+-translocating ferredoxin:NAD+ oxidoreductase RNF subunit RnfB
LAAKKFGNLHPVQTTNYLPQLNHESCIDCGKCIEACPIDAISRDGENIVIDKDICLGCGVCVRSCPNHSLSLKRRKEEIITPVNSVHRTVLMAIERGKLANLIFENQAFGSHRAMAAVVSAILKLPPIKQMMASKQLKSRYLEKIIKKLA